MRYFVLAAFYCLLITSCKKSDEPAVPGEPQMPPKTDTGVNMLAFKMNGKVQFYDRKSTYLNANGIYINTRQKDLNQELIVIRAHKTVYRDDLDIRVNTWDIELNKEYALSTDSSIAYAKYYTGSSNNTRGTKEGSGSIVFRRFDSLVVAGEFHFTAFLNSSQIEITEGFFDISLKE